MKRKILSLILVFAMTVSLLTVGTGAVEPTYGDTAGHWAESSIERWSGHGIIQGSNGLFDPNGQLTCAQLATILAKLLKLPAAASAGFTDVKSDAWYADAIDRCVAAGILNGNGDGTVSPTAPITRERAMVMLGRALGIQPVENPDLSKHSDAAKVSNYAQGIVAAMIEAGIVTGVGGNQIAPQDDINRASTVTILDRAIAAYADQAGETVKADGKGIVLVVADDVTVTGDMDKLLVPADNVDVTVSGSKNIDDITVTGDNSKVILNNSTANDVTLDGKNAELETKGSSKVENISVTEDAKGATVNAGSGTTIGTVDSKADGVAISGDGKVEKASVSGDNTKVDTKGTKVDVAEGVTGTTAGGKEVSGGTTTETKPSTPSGSSSGGSYTPPHTHSYVYSTDWDTLVSTKTCSNNDSTETVEGIYYIADDVELGIFRDWVNDGSTFEGKTIELTADIDLNNTEWTPIGTNEHPFKGVFDGKGKTIRNLKITSTGSYNGLFGKVVGITDGASFKTAANEVWNAEAYTLSNCEESQFKTIIKDFTIDDFSVTTGRYGAAAVGWAENTYVGKITVKNGTVSDNGASEKGKIAAVVGVSGRNMLYDRLKTEATVTIIGRKHSIAGIVSNIQQGNDGTPHLVVIKDCENNADVRWIENGGTSGGLPIAGIVANAGSCNGLEVVIYKCTNNGEITANECNYACGIVGQAGDWVKAVYDCHNTGNITARAVEYGVAGICITECIPAIACSNSGTLTNLAEGGHTYDISSGISQLTIVNETFADVSALQTRINNAVGTATTLILKNITVSDTTGMLTIPNGIQHISANTKVCDSISLPNALVNIDMIGLTQTVTGTVCRTFSGSGNTITVAEGAEIGDIVIAGTNNTFTNNGRMGNVAISGNGTIVINNGSDATMAGVTMIATTATATLNNYGTMHRTSAGGHCVWVEASGTLTVNNHGSISATGEGNRYALLFYDGCTITVNAYTGSSVTGGFAPYRGMHTITVNYQTDAHYENGSWDNLPCKDQYGVTVRVMQ